MNAPAQDRVIKIETTTAAAVKKDTLEIDVSVKNNGTAAAHFVQVFLDMFGEEIKGPVTATIDPGGSDRILFDRKLAGVRNGRHPLIVRVEFHDANQYPFSALTATTFSYGETDAAGVAVSSVALVLTEVGSLKYDIRNAGAESRNIRANLILPKELSAQTPRKEIRVEPGSEEFLAFEINNFSALPGAHYPVFCTFEYDANGVHHTEVARTTVSIAKKENLFRRLRGLWVVLIVVLTVGLVAVIMKK